MNGNKIFKYSLILALVIAIVYVLALISISLFIYKKKSNINIMPIKIETVYELERQSRPLYKAVKLRNLFRKYPKKVSGLTFGYICPGAMKTLGAHVFQVLLRTYKYK